MARKCSTALVDPPVAMISDTAFSMELRVMMSRGRIPRRTASTRTRADSAVLSAFSASGLAMVDEDINDMPSASNEELMVLAVYMPPQEPVEGQAWRSMPSKSSWLILPAMKEPTASKEETMERSLPFHLPGLIVPP